MQLYRISEAALVLGVCTKTIQRWDAAGKIKCHRTVGGHRRISILEIERVLNHQSISPLPPDHSQIAIYCRISPHDQKKNGDLAKQIATWLLADLQYQQVHVLRLEDLSWAKHARKQEVGYFLATWQVHWFFA
ncbi:MAG: recombinase family protein [Promethearchaeota archaeon]